MMALTHKQQAFVEQYLACFNASEAARRAGYAEARAAQTGRDLRRVPEVAAAISERLAEASLSASETLSLLAEVARGDHARFFRGSGRDAQFDAAACVEAGLGRLIVEMAPGELGTKYKFADRLGALNTLAKHHNLLVERRELSGPGGGAIEHHAQVDLSRLSDEQLAQLERIHDDLYFARNKQPAGDDSLPGGGEGGGAAAPG